METITNAASTVTSTVSNLIYGAPAKDTETAHNETAGQEPISGQQGKGTVNEPFDQGNAATPLESSTGTTSASGSTSYKQDDFLSLNPTLGTPANTDSTTDTKTGTTSETGMPIIPLNPAVGTKSSETTTNTSSSATGMTDKTGVTDKVWKETALDEIKPSGAPGAGPSAPDYKVATPDTSLASSTSDKVPEHHHSVDATKDSTTSHDSAAPKKDAEASHPSPHAQPPVGGPIDDILNKGPTAGKEHTVDESEAEDPHSKMNDKTVRHTDASKHAGDDKVESHPAEVSTHHSESSKAAAPVEPASHTESEEKNGKMSRLTGKLKDKLHIGSKDK